MYTIHDAECDTEKGNIILESRADCHTVRCDVILCGDEDGVEVLTLSNFELRAQNIDTWRPINLTYEQIDLDEVKEYMNASNMLCVALAQRQAEHDLERALGDYELAY